MALALQVTAAELAAETVLRCTQSLTQEVLEILGLSEKSVGPHVPLSSLGLDSMQIVGVRSALQSTLNVSYPLAEVGPTILPFAQLPQRSDRMCKLRDQSGLRLARQTCCRRPRASSQSTLEQGTCRLPCNEPALMHAWQSVLRAVSWMRNLLKPPPPAQSCTDLFRWRANLPSVPCRCPA